MPRLLVIGDVTLDIDEFYVQTKERDGYPVYELERREQRYGCAEAVGEMCRAMGVEADVAWIDRGQLSQKRRVIVADRVACRFDIEKKCDPLNDDWLQCYRDGWCTHTRVRNYDVILIADYAKGAIDAELIAAIQNAPGKREVIADWHPSRKMEWFDLCPTAFKASWGDSICGYRPFIRTMGANGMLLHHNAETEHFPALEPNPLDPCGAGDMVLATLGVGRLMGLSWQECCEWASENAAEVCRHWGSVPVVSKRRAVA